VQNQKQVKLTQLEYNLQQKTAELNRLNAQKENVENGMR
jgi:hypothetical protein